MGLWGFELSAEAPHHHGSVFSRFHILIERSEALTDDTLHFGRHFRFWSLWFGGHHSSMLAFCRSAGQAPRPSYKMAQGTTAPMGITATAHNVFVT